MKNINLLVVEGNIKKENDNFHNYGIQTHVESLKNSLEYYSKDLNIDRLSQMALDDPSTATNPIKMKLDDMKILYVHSISGELF